ncbi:13074_t:CDS:1 [Acaulospora morrowiae]|uniref:13074_t:CDS:1 n=1 Tax=Acaulospora morrowiae TaxID=94023 RepID=A0A9N9AS27_9GLOM|nr:13074_t:CDS:1 [Acaulospora morrowiae]
MSSKNLSEGSTSSPSSLTNFVRWIKTQVLRVDQSKSTDSTKKPSSFKASRSFPSSKLFAHNDPNKKCRHSDSFMDDAIWVEEELIDKDDLILSDMPSVILEENGIYTSLPTSPVGSTEQAVGMKKNCLKDTHIVRGSVEHFAYVRTLRKMRPGRVPKPLFQMIMLNGTITKLSCTYEFSEFQREELRCYKTRVYGINRRYSRSNAGGSTLESQSNSAVDKKLAIVTKYQTESQVVVRYRPSYSSTKVLTIYDEDLNELVVKDLPLARKRRRASNSSISSISTNSTSTLVRSSSTSSNSSLSSSTTLADPDGDVISNKSSLRKAMSLKLNKLRLSKMGKMATKHQKRNTVYEFSRHDDDGNNGGGDDDVSLFVLKEQFKYSGRTCSNAFQRCPSNIKVRELPVGGNESQLTTLTV